MTHLRLSEKSIFLNIPKNSKNLFSQNLFDGFEKNQVFFFFQGLFDPKNPSITIITLQKTKIIEILFNGSAKLSIGFFSAED